MGESLGVFCLCGMRPGDFLEKIGESGGVDVSLLKLE
jgi:hypothetical protein